MACERPKPFHVNEPHSHFGNPFLQKSFRLLGNRLWHVICAHNRYGEWMIGEASGIVGRFESRLRQQRNHTIFPAFGSPLDFHYQLLAGARSNQIGGRSALARLLDYFPAFLAKEIGYDQPELGFVARPRSPTRAGRSQSLSSLPRERDWLRPARVGLRGLATGLDNGLASAYHGHGIHHGQVNYHGHDISIQPRRQDSRTNSVTGPRSEEHTSELQSRLHLVCRLLLGTK